MANVVDELDALKAALDGEAALRQLLQAALQRGAAGAYAEAHEQAIAECVAAARALVAAAG
jgi:hypothetical protein